MAGGYCVVKTAAIACQEMAGHACSRSDEFCCKRQFRSQEVKVVKRSQCSLQGGSCVPLIAGISCQRLDAACDGVLNTCCLFQAEVTTTPKPAISQTCESAGGICMYVGAAIYCPSRLDATCSLNGDACCRLQS
ncbi:uncharacterized protein LOC131942819 [Physella acuta]|uniref:uncharacterized protein LOC131942819 n=1 Tax=Physella acuta TaxID=109671 RepID=UPI0027DB886B|nr:uncharacterized protein LOC131942819 [Physella acuta]